MKKRDNGTYSACHSEGSLFLADQLQRIFAGNCEHQDDADYNISASLKFKDECSRAYTIARDQWKAYQKALRNQSSLAATVSFVQSILSTVLGYTNGGAESVIIAGRTYPQIYRANGLPVVIAPQSITVDEAHRDFAIEGGSGYKKSPFQLIQEFLNASDKDQWGLVSNGNVIRLLRDATSLTRPSYVEFDLKHILENQDYAEFIYFWRFLHSSRTQEIDGKNIWDHWIKLGEEEGQRIRERLSYGVTRALTILGNGFLKQDKNQQLRAALNNGDMDSEQFLRELLRLMYRFIFVFCLEERDLINIKGEATEKARERYRKGYALHRFVHPCLKNRFWNRYTDAWESVQVVFTGLERGCERLALPALGGLFKREQCRYLIDCDLDNESFFRAMQEVRWAEHESQRILIDYRNMGTEELGGVYETLLELVPTINTVTWDFGFVGLSNAGNERKSSGSYYTPDVLVQELIKTALDPVIEQKLKDTENPEQSLLTLKVIDPTCGSGHFLLSAARRIASKLAEIRSGGQALTPEMYRTALRDVVRNCLYGVDKNPLAIELARMALWLEGYEEGRPLSFLDHHLKVGDSLVGVFNMECPKNGIASTAYKKTGYDDKEVCVRLRKKNSQFQKALDDRFRSNQLYMEYEEDFYSQWANLEGMAETTLQEIEDKEATWKKLEEEEKENPQRTICNLYMASFLGAKTKNNERLVPTNQALWAGLISDHDLEPNWNDQVAFANGVCKEYMVFHWPLEFPQVFREGGFDCVLGNPPWEKAKMEDVKWFSSRYPAIGDKDLKQAERKKLINKLSEGKLAAYLADPKSANSVTVDFETAKQEKKLYSDYKEESHRMEAVSNFCHLDGDDGGRFPLTGHGDTNLYAYCSELAINLCRKGGRVGLVVPTGIVTEDATKLFAQELFSGHLVSLYDIENKEGFFNIHRSYRYSLITIGEADKADCVFYIHSLKDMDDPERHVQFTPADIAMMNPNTKTCPIMRSKRDFEINHKIYEKFPVLQNETVNAANAWAIKFLRMFDMTNDSDKFQDAQEDLVPLYEGKMVHQYDDRYATFDKKEARGNFSERDVKQQEKENSSFNVLPRYWLYLSDIEEKFCNKKTKERFWSEDWIFVYRAISRATDERTLIMSVLPSSVGAGNSLEVVLPEGRDSSVALLLANCNSIIFDYLLRLKQSGANANLFFVKQVPIIENFSEKDKEFIVSRVAKLTRNSDQIRAVWLTDYPDYKWQSEEERLQLRCELDAYFAKLYGLDRRDLEFILDPSEAVGKEYPSVTFPVLKEREISEYGEYKTRRLVLEAWDKLEQGLLQ